MRKNKLLLLLALLMMAVPHSYAKVYESNLNYYDDELSNGESATIDGIVIRVNSGTIEFELGRDWQGYDGANSFTISTALGETITGIEITCDVEDINGTGWTEKTPGVVWSGSSTSVNFGEYLRNVTHIKVTVADAPTYTITYFKAEGATLPKTSETYTFGSDTKITLPSITSTDGKDYKWMLSKYGRAFGETTSPCAGLNGTIYNSGDEISLSNVYGDLEFTTVYIGCQIDCGSSSDRWWEESWAYLTGGKYAVVNLKNRKLYKDGYWNTLTLPFNLSAEKLATTCLAGADIRKFVSASVDGDKLTINFSGSNLGEIEAYVPYIIRWGTPETATGETIVNPSFTNVEVAITSQEDLDDEENGYETENNGLRFEAQIGPVQLKSGSNALVFGSENKLYKPNKNVYVYATRAYFSHTFDIASAREFVLDFGDGDQQTTYIDGITVDGNRGSGVEGIFNLSGQRLSAPQKGINIVNGKKVVIK